MMIYVYMINVGVLVMIVECNARRSPIDQADTLCSDMANQPAIQPASQTENARRGIERPVHRDTQIWSKGWLSAMVTDHDV